MSVVLWYVACRERRFERVDYVRQEVQALYVGEMFSVEGLCVIMVLSCLCRVYPDGYSQYSNAQNNIATKVLKLYTR